MSDYNLRHAESLGKRMTKPELVKYIARILDEKSACEAAAQTTLVRLAEALDKFKRFEKIERAVEAVSRARNKEDPSAAVDDIADNCDAICDAIETRREWGAMPALERAVEDRNALLRRCGLTDSQWSAQGGASHTDFEI